MEKKNISARFICALTIYGLKKTYTINWYYRRSDIKKKIGKNGFGYDPIFIPNRKKLTFGQMNYSEKSKIDHRMKAFSKIKKFF